MVPADTHATVYTQLAMALDLTPTAPMKTCRACREVKDLGEFHRHPKTRDRHVGICKSCAAEAHKQWAKANRAAIAANKRRWDLANVERKREHDRQYRSRNPEANRRKARAWAQANPERVRERGRARYLADPGKWREWARDQDRKRRTDALYGRVNRQKITEQARLRRLAYPEVAKANSQRRRARKRNAAGTCSPAQLAARIQYHGGQCWVCKAPWEQIDHVKPLAKGGSNWPGNLRPICRSCNYGKRDSWPVTPELLTCLRAKSAARAVLIAAA